MSKRIEKLAEEYAKAQGLPAFKHEWMTTGGSTLDYQVFDLVAEAYEAGARRFLQDAAGVAEKHYYSKYTQANGYSPEEVWEYDANLAAEIRALGEQE